MRLILNADDFGYTLGVTDGIAKAMVDGILTDTSFLVNTQYFDYAVSKANEINLKKLGLHLQLTNGQSLLGHDKLPTITQEDGTFYRYPTDIPEANLEEIELEFRAQLTKFKESGLTLTHLDVHVDIYGSIGDDLRRLVISLALEEGVSMRRVEEENNSMRLFDSTKGFTTDYLDTFPSKNSVPATLDNLISVLDKYKDKNCIVEVICHPGIVDEELLRSSRFNYRREVELNVITSDGIKEYIKKNNIELVDFSAVTSETYQNYKDKQ